MITKQQKNFGPKISKPPIQPQQPISRPRHTSLASNRKLGRQPQPSPFDSNLQQIKTVVCKYYTLIRIIVLVPLSVVSRISGIYFLVNIVMSSEQRFDTWWKMLSLIGYIFYFTVGSILFFFIAPELDIYVRRRVKSYGFFEGAFDDIKGLVFRNRYQVPKIIFDDSQQEQQKEQKGQKYKDNQPQKSSIQQQNTSQIIKEEIKPQLNKNNPLQQRRIKILKQSSIYKCKKMYEETQKEIQLERTILKMKQEQRKLEQKSEVSEYQNCSRRASKSSQQLQTLKKLYETNRLRRKKQIVEDQQFQQKLSKKQKKAEEELSKIQNFQKQINSYNKLLSFSSQKQYEAKAKTPQLTKIKYDTPIIQWTMWKQKQLLQLTFKNHSRIIGEEIIQYNLFAHEFEFLPQNQKQDIIFHNHLILKLERVNQFQTKQKKFYLFLFNLLDATDAMIAWYDYYQLPDKEKFEKFQASYYFLILCFEQIPQIIAQGCSLNYVYQNKLNVAIFGISVLKLLVCTFLRLYKAYNQQNNKTKSQKFKSEVQLRVKWLSNNFQIQNECEGEFCCILCCCPCTFLSLIVVNLFPIVNRILLYVFLCKVRYEDQMMFQISIICVAYYFIVANSLTIIAFNMSDEDRESYHDHIFTRIPAKWMRWFISFLLVLLNSLNICSLPALLYKFQDKIRDYSRILSNKFVAFYFKHIYIYFAFEGIPFLIIYSLAHSRSTLKDKGFYTLVLVFGCVNVVCMFVWFLYLKWKYQHKDQVMRALKK